MADKTIRYKRKFTSVTQYGLPRRVAPRSDDVLKMKVYFHRSFSAFLTRCLKSAG